MKPIIRILALLALLAGSVQALLDENAPVQDVNGADTAIFYSISNCQKGLAGVSFGNFLIKQVVEEISRELPKLSTYVTLSPVPGFAAWLARERAQERLRLGLEVARRGLREREIDDRVAEQRHTHLQPVRHAGAVGLGEAVLAQIGPQVGAHQRVAVHRAAEGAREKVDHCAVQPPSIE